jgi:predicted dehydrogenase
VANFTASRVSTERVRKLRFFQAGQYISIDYGRQDVLVFSVGSASGMTAEPSVNPQIAMTKPAITAEEPLLAEIKAFLQAVRERSRPAVSLEDGRRALELGLAILAEIGRHAARIGVGKASGLQ